MKICLVLISLLLISCNGFAGDTIFKVSQVSFAASTAMDYVSGATLDSSKFRESNPVLTQDKRIQAAVMAGTSVAVWYTSKRVYKRNKVAGVLILAIGAVAHGLAARHNMRLRQ